MNWPFVSRATHDRELAALRRDMAVFEGSSSAWFQSFTRLMETHDALLDRYHALRVSGSEAPAPAFVPPENPMTQLGPLTRAALADMGHGQSGIVKRAMQSKAFLIWLDQKNEANRDELTAIAVRQGETR